MLLAKVGAGGAAGKGRGRGACGCLLFCFCDIVIMCSPSKCPLAQLIAQLVAGHRRARPRGGVISLLARVCAGEAGGKKKWALLAAPAAEVHIGMYMYM